MSQHEFEFETGNAAKTLSEILALIAPDEAAELGERIQSGFKSVHHVLGASLSELSDLGGPKTVRLVRLVERLVRDLALERIHETRDHLSGWTALTEYLRVRLCGVQIEKFLCLYLDKKNRLIKVVETEGTIDRCPVYPREVLRNALMLNATAMILVHNHPSGDPTPSQSDIDITKKIITCASVMNIAVHDHCIVGDNEVVSLKGLGLM